MRISFVFFIVISFVIACGSTPPKLQTIPQVNMVQVPDIPANEDLSTNIRINKSETSSELLSDNVISRKNFVVKSNARVVISVPVEQQRKEAKRELDKKIRTSTTWNNRQEQGQKDLQTSDNLAQKSDDSFNTAEFSTAEYFNKAEQQIEKSLLGKNFMVMDRSKFEAELRDRREESRGNNDSEAKKAEIRNIEELRDSKQITRDQYVEKLQDIESKYDIISQSNTREVGDNELVDISELIRAAQEGKNQADYILQVNSFDIGPISDRQLALSEQSQINNLALEHPQLIDAMYDAGYAVITQPGYFGYLNAKLIDVQTGAIVWVGEHRVQSENVTNIDIQLTMSREVSNEKEVSDAISSHNKSLTKQKNLVTQIGASTQQQGLSSDVQQQRLNEYNTQLAVLNKMLQAKVEIPQWQYRYNISQPNVQPNFPSYFEMQKLQKSSNDSQRAYNEYLRIKDRMGRHQSEIAKKVSKELISTIPASE